MQWYKIKPQEYWKNMINVSRPNVHCTFVHKNFTVTHLTSLQNKITSHQSRQFTQYHNTSHNSTYLHSTPTLISLLVTTFLTLFLNVFS
jgi:phenylpropionate dioxygenase-like ring-hydroxylating dioxygenase large terminal subunit